MELVTEGRPGGLEALAEQAVVAACALADAADPGEWSAGAVEDAATALEVLAARSPGSIRGTRTSWPWSPSRRPPSPSARSRPAPAPRRPTATSAWTPVPGRGCAARWPRTASRGTASTGWVPRC
ncbi:hypothetical protein [Streptomyces somaliensis]|uniref:hypothetical protein n=1 Tax=Streptomyces somaliensis TaxID=78355 RepID=UPI0034E95521|nr:hypothetical protein [Streptomyces somaliensis]